MSEYDPGDDTESTASIPSYIHEGLRINGRNYHAFHPEKEYLAPNDEREQERLFLGYVITCAALKNRLFRAPIVFPQNILDVGTGTGDWAIAVAGLHPYASVIGIDLSPIQPEWVLPNVQFIVDDAEDIVKDPTEYNKYDMVRVGFLDGSIPDWEKFVKKLSRLLKPGGYIEFMERDIEIEGHRPEGWVDRWQSEIQRASESRGKELNIGRRLESLLQQAGFENINKESIKIPFSEMPKNELANWNLRYTLDSFEALGLRWLTPNPEALVATHVLFAFAKRELLQDQGHCFTRWYSLYAQKPHKRAVNTGTDLVY